MQGTQVTNTASFLNPCFLASHLFGLLHRFLLNFFSPINKVILISSVHCHFFFSNWGIPSALFPCQLGDCRDSVLGCLVDWSGIIPNPLSWLQFLSTLIHDVFSWLFMKLFFVPDCDRLLNTRALNPCLLIPILDWIYFCCQRNQQQWTNPWPPWPNSTSSLFLQHFCFEINYSKNNVWSSGIISGDRKWCLMLFEDFFGPSCITL